MNKVKQTLISHMSAMQRQFANLEDLQIEKFVEIIKQNKATVFLTGIGKNAHVASTTASTFSSIGIKSRFLDPVEAVHGEMGNIENNDLIIAISKSGNTSELLNFLKKFKEINKVTKIVSLSSNEKSQMVTLADLSIVIDIEKEIDKYNIVPTISIATYILFLQSIGYCVAEQKGFNLAMFKKNHPGGAIGDKLRGLEL